MSRLPPSRLCRLTQRPCLCLAAVFALACSACAGPYGTAKSIGAVGGLLAGAGGTAWVVGETTDSESLIAPGVAGVVLGAVGIFTAAAMMASQASCRSDADCVPEHVCRELLQPAGRESFSQCVPR